MSSEFTVLETIVKPDGFEFDLKEAFRKLATSQFGGSPGRGFCELIQNAMDSYDGVPMADRPIHIQTSHSSISVRDEGEGMPIERINLLATLGGTDKAGNSEKLGRFGMGFFAVFNPHLETSKVEVRTRCGSRIVLLEFIVDSNDPTALPRLQTEIITRGARRWHGTEVTVQFRSSHSVTTCVEAARQFVRYARNPVFIEGKRYTDTAWEQAQTRGARFFEVEGRYGFIESRAGDHQVSVLCKYEPLLEVPINYFATFRQDATESLPGFKRLGLPFVPGTFTVINDNTLTVTVSRDKVMADSHYWELVKAVGNIHLEELRQRLTCTPDNELIVANQYVFAANIRDYLQKPSVAENDVLHQVLVQLTDYPIYRLAGKTDAVSLRHIWQHRSADKPVFYSPNGLNTNWLGGAFEHDFVVIAPTFLFQSTAANVLGDLFAEVFADVVNLDRILDDREAIQRLVKRGIVPAELLRKKCNVIGAWQTTAEEQCFLTEVNQL